MPSGYQLAANGVLILHVGYVAFVVLGLLLILVGGLFRWRWVRNRWFRAVHLLAITIVVLESWLNITCPLTTLENWLRVKAGAETYEGDFIAIWLHSILFFDLPPWVFVYGYTAFGAAVLAGLILVPPKLRAQRTSDF
ncbi:MAG: DUF2784 domain-containing protein [Planctomycetaceae bacterium]|nr:DUF2784 domain-containing protein [Planctomycetaceae bacterium]